MRSIAAIALLAVAIPAVALPAVAMAGDIEIKGAEMRASIGHSPNTAGYMTIVNHGAKPDRLLSASCGCAGMVMVHKTEVSGGMAMMMSEPAITIPAHGEVTFKPGGLHLMVMDLKKPVALGTVQDVTLTFEHAGKVTAVFLIKTQIDAAPAGSSARSQAGSMGAMPGM
jgi:copper(I)-binding protein